MELDFVVAGDGGAGTGEAAVGFEVEEVGEKAGDVLGGEIHEVAVLAEEEAGAEVTVDGLTEGAGGSLAVMPEGLARAVGAAVVGDGDHEGD